MNFNIIKDFASKIALDQLNEVNSKNKIINSILKFKLMEEIDNQNIYLDKCNNCNKLYFPYHSKHSFYICYICLKVVTLI